MAWRCSGVSNDELIDKLTAANLVKDEKAIAAMRAVDRKLFSKDKDEAYQDSPHAIGYNATISAPHMHASCLEILKDHLQAGSSVLDVGSGSGYLTACLAHMVRVANNAARAESIGGSKVVGIEHIPELTIRSIAAVEQVPFANEMLQEGALTFVTGDGLQGHAEGGPYNAIHVGAAAPTIPQPLLDQLAPGGRMVLPVGLQHSAQELIIVDKDKDGTCRERSLMGVVYVPLTSRQHQLGLYN